MARSWRCCAATRRDRPKRAEAFSGVPINAVAARLGHSTPVITLKVYGHVLRRAEDQAVSVAGKLLEGALP